ncbi:MAG: hypothetical protein C0487_06775 [Leptothrix sp. (in: Bacteria)]|nr:hypothetical protein [Leptothrix sp. (in: b-proteobacteria)]
MIRRNTVKAASLACLILLGTQAARADLIADIPAGTGYAAWELCTRTQQSGDDYLRVRWFYTAPKVQPLPVVWTIKYDPGNKVDVSSFIPFITNKRTAVYRPGLGCTLVPPGATDAGVRAQAFKPAPLPMPSAQPWPTGEGTTEAARLTPAQAALLAAHGDRIFTETTTKLSQKQNALAFLVARDGHLVYERYARDYRRDQPQLGWSMTKSLTGLIAGVMATDGRLDLDAPVGLPQWAGSAKAAITWKQLLNMAPGMAWNEGYEGASDATQMLFSQPNQGAWAAERPLTSAPGTVFNYSTGFATVATYAIKLKLGGGHQALYDYYQQRLFAPLGIRQGVIEPDASGTPVGGARGVLRPVDWLRLGQLVAQGGQWQGQTLIAPSAMNFLVAASPASAEYGGFIWRQPATAIPESVRVRLPADLVWFAGHMGQFLVIVPSQNLVVLRMGVSFEKDLARTQVFEAVADLIEAGHN